MGRGRVTRLCARLCRVLLRVLRRLHLLGRPGLQGPEPGAPIQCPRSVPDFYVPGFLSAACSAAFHCRIQCMIQCYPSTTHTVFDRSTSAMKCPKKKTPATLAHLPPSAVARIASQS